MPGNDSPRNDSYKAILDAGFIEYKQLLIDKFKQMDKIQSNLNNLQLEFAVLKTKSSIISAGIAFVLSGVISLVLHFLKLH